MDYTARVRKGKGLAAFRWKSSPLGARANACIPGGLASNLRWTRPAAIFSGYARILHVRSALDVRVNAKTPGGFWLQKETDSHIRKKLQPSMERRPVMAKLRAGRLCLPCGAIVLVARDACPRNPAQGGFVCRMERSCLSRETRARRSPRGMCLPCGAIAPACRSALSPERETGPRPTPRTCP